MKILSAPSSADTTRSELDEQKEELVAIRALLKDTLSEIKTQGETLMKISGATKHPLTGEFVYIE